MKVEFELPDDSTVVVFTEGGAGQPNRLILQFKHMKDMHLASEGLTKSIQAANEAYVKWREEMDAWG